jgi:hypothetical protein
VRDALFVLGMGRGGTSALTHVLSLCGAALPRTLLQRNSANARGYWEPASALRINDEFLSAHASSWWDPLPRTHEIALDDPCARRYVDRIVEFLRDEYPADGTIIVKDPRISGLFPYWLEATRRLGLQAKVIQIVRHPDEVAASLRSRDGVRRNLSNLLWLKYNLLGLADAADIPHVVVDYTSLLDDWVSVVRTCIDVCALDLAVTAEASEMVETFLTRSLRHHHADPATIADDTTGHLLTAAYRALSVASATAPDPCIVAGLAERFHSLPEIAERLPSAELFETLPITTRMIGNCDIVIPSGADPVPLEHALPIDANFSFQIRGWALRMDGCLAVDQIIVTQDGHPTSEGTQENREDVIDLYGPQAALCGFVVQVKGSTVVGRAHRFEIYAVSAAKRTKIGAIDAHVCGTQPVEIQDALPMGDLVISR